LNLFEIKLKAFRFNRINTVQVIHLQPSLAHGKLH
jgi:hypothetical protein